MPNLNDGPSRGRASGRDGEVVSAFIPLISLAALLVLGIGMTSCGKKAHLTSSAEEHLYPVTVQKKWGFMNAGGKLRIRPSFDHVGFFVEGCALVEVAKKVGFIDKNGTVVVPPRFDAAFDFREGLARVQLGAKWGFIDKTGQFVIPPELQDNGAMVNADIGSFYEGLTRMLAGSDTLRAKWGFMDKTGNFAINPKYDGAWAFENGIAAVRTKGKWGFINRSGDMVVAPRFDDIDTSGPALFRDGLALIKIGDMYGYIDRSGRAVVQPQFRGANTFDGGLATAAIGKDCIAERLENSEWVKNPTFDCRWGVIDNTGKFVVEPQFRDAQRFAEGLAAVATGSYCSVFKTKDSSGKEVENRLRDCQYGYLDGQGRMVIAPQFDHAGDFKNGFAVVAIAGAIGMIDRVGKYLINPQDKGVLPFDGELAGVVGEDEIRYVDRRGRIVEPIIK